MSTPLPPPAPRMDRALREALIEQVQRRPVLYDTRREDHRETELRDRAWLDIADTLQINSEVLKREWKILRDSLRQALNKRTHSNRRNSRWYFESKMAFLVPHMTRRAALAEEENSEAPPARAASSLTPGLTPGLAPDDGLALFFASVCACARALPPASRAALKRRVLDALLQLEAEAEDNANSLDCDD